VVVVMLMLMLMLEKKLENILYGYDTESLTADIPM